MRRFVNGGTNAPTYRRPGSGWGRTTLGAPRPIWNVPASPLVEASMFVPAIDVPTFIWVHGGQEPAILWTQAPSRPTPPDIEVTTSK